MRNFKKFLTLALAALMIMSVFATSAFATFKDVDANNEALTKAVNLLATLEITKGKTADTFGPTDLVTREQMAAFVYRLMKAGKSVEGGANTSSFTDLKDSTFFYMVSWANNAGVIKGRTPTAFDPTGNIVLQDAYTMVVRALGYEKEEALPYPFGYIDVAESIGLDENLPSSVSYMDNLTRGDIAIILYNAFYADMNETYTEYVEKALTGNTYQLVAVEKNDTVARKIFKVEKTVMRVTATPNYAFDKTGSTPSTKRTGSDTNDVDLVKLDGNLVYSEDYNKNLTDFVKPADNKVKEVKFADLGLDGKADDYFLSDLTLFVKGDKVLAATSNLVTATDTGKLDRVTGTETTDYYNGTPKEAWNKKLTGLVTVGSLKGYLFDAPYSFTEKSSDIYAADKSKSKTRLINLTGEAGPARKDKKNTYLYTANQMYDGSEMIETDYTQDAIKTKALAQAFYEGYYEMTAYDCNGDGFAEYIFYKPYTFGQLVEDNTEKNSTTYEYATKEQHKDNTTANTYYANRAIGAGLAAKYDKKPIIFTKEAVVEGVEHKNGDYALAYVNGPANYIKVATIVKPVTSKVVSFSDQSITLASGAVCHLFDTGAKLLGYMGDMVADSITSTSRQEPIADENKRETAYKYLIDPAKLGKNEGEYFVYGSKLLFFNGKNQVINVDTKYAIVQPRSNTNTSIYITTNELVDGVMKDVVQLNAFIDGALKTIKFSEKNEEGIRYDNEAAASTALKGKLATYSVDSNGLYSLTAVETKADDLRTDIETAEYSNNGTNAVLKKAGSGSLYEFLNFNTTTKAPTTKVINNNLYLTIKEYSQVIIRNWDDTDAEFKFTVYNSNKLPDLETIGDDAANFINYSIRVINNTQSSSNENLVILYAEVAKVSSSTNANQLRIIKSVTGKTEGSSTVYYYDVYNPFTGEEELALKGTATSGAAVIAAKKNTVWYTAGVNELKTSAAAAHYTLADRDENGVLVPQANTWIVTDYDPSTTMLELKNKDTGAALQLLVDDKTTISFIDLSEDTIKKQANAEILESKSLTYNEELADETKEMRVYFESEDVSNQDLDRAVFVVVYRS